MPLYSYTCPCGQEDTRFLKLAQSDDPQFCGCGRQMARKIEAPMVLGDYAPYSCPITGRPVEGRRAHIENLKKHGCRILEPGESDQVRRNRANFEKKLDQEIERTVEQVAREIHTNPTT